jgi:transcriptional regulator GlxA family with amidase domain
MAAAVSASTRREYAARMNRVVDHIQKHLSEPLDLERAAQLLVISARNGKRTRRMNWDS